jgi:hypothetical protein
MYSIPTDWKAKFHPAVKTGKILVSYILIMFPAKQGMIKILDWMESDTSHTW